MTVQSTRTKAPQERTNIINLRTNPDLLEERKADDAIRQDAYKAMTEKYYNARFKRAACKIGDLVLRKNEES